MAMDIDLETWVKDKFCKECKNSTEFKVVVEDISVAYITKEPDQEIESQEGERERVIKVKCKCGLELDSYYARC